MSCSPHYFEASLLGMAIGVFVTLGMLGLVGSLFVLWLRGSAVRWLKGIV